MAKLIAIYIDGDYNVTMDNLPPGSRTAQIDLPDRLSASSRYKFTYEIADLLLKSVTTQPGRPPPPETGDPAPAHLREDLRTV